MLIKALSDYYDLLAAEGKIIPDGYSNVNIHYLVVLNEEGKIPEELYNINAASAFIPLAGIKEVAPESDMTRGEVYYIESTGKLWTALSDSTGTISDPVPGFVYTYNNDYYTWTGLSLRPFGRITTKDIIDITEIF